MATKLMSFTHYPVEDLLLTFRNNQNLIFVKDESNLVNCPQFNGSYDTLLIGAGISVEGIGAEVKFNKCHKLLDNLLADDFINEWRPKEMVYIKGIETLLLNRGFTLSSKGLELVLKIEAHNDAERRHNDTHKHNTLMRWIAGSSFLLSFIAVSLSGFLAYVANKNMELNQQRLEIQQQQIKSIYEKVNSENDDMTKQE